MNARPFQAEVLGPAAAAKRPFELCPDVAGADRAIDAPAPGTRHELLVSERPGSEASRLFAYARS
jgi:hypothetical protein